MNTGKSVALLFCVGIAFSVHGMEGDNGTVSEAKQEDVSEQMLSFINAFMNGAMEVGEQEVTYSSYKNSTIVFTDLIDDIPQKLKYAREKAKEAQAASGSISAQFSTPMVLLRKFNDFLNEHGMAHLENTATKPLLPKIEDALRNVRQELENLQVTQNFYWYILRQKKGEEMLQEKLDGITSNRLALIQAVRKGNAGDIQRAQQKPLSLTQLIDQESRVAVEHESDPESDYEFSY